MPIRIQCVVIDSADPDALATFWAAVLGWRRTFEAPHEVALEPPAGSPEDGVSPDLLFVRASAERVGKSRLHLDLRPVDQAVEVARIEALGARRTDVGQPADASWIVMADPEGNEFCVLRAFTAEELASIGPTG